jgi:3-oxoacyl-[acyl-carrier-protein] synthase II
VVVTGIGLVSPVGLGTDATWTSVLAGRPGVGTITLFDPSRHAVRFAGEVKGFDPLQWLDRKEVKKCGRFIQFAIAATSMAMSQSGLQIHDGNATRVGVTIGSGIGGFEVIEREHTTLLERGPDRVSPFFILSAIVNLAAGQVSHDRRKRPELRGRNCLHDRRAFHRRRSSDPGGLCRCDGVRRDRSLHHPAGGGRVRLDARVVGSNDAPDSASRPWTRNVTGSSSAKALASWCRGARSRRATRRANPRRSSRSTA